MKKFIIILSAISSSFSLVAQNTNTSSTTATGTPATANQNGNTQSSIVAASDYKITPGDQMQFAVYGEVETNTVIRVSQEGKVILPFIGSVEVAGLSVGDARNKITALYKPDYYVDPQINLIVTSINVKIVNFMGTGINRPGPVEIPADRDLYLLEAIAKAGSFSRVGSFKIQIKRDGPENGKPIILKYDATKIGPKEVKLQPDDVIWVDEFGFWGN